MPLQAFFLDRRQNRVAWSLLFWRDLLLFGTLLNICTTLLSLVLLSKNVSMGAVLAIHLLQLPYALFIIHSLWRAPNCPSWVQCLSLGWLSLTLIV
jgi:hypothetical protein